MGIGLSSGFLGGLLGIGGGPLIVACLVLFLDLNQHLAHGTSLAIVLATSMAGVVSYAAHGMINYQWAAAMAVGGAAGAFAGAKAANAVHGLVLRRLFCVLLVVVGVRMILASCGDSSAQDQVPALLRDGAIRGTLVLVGTGLLAGFISSLFGIGGGMVMIPALTVALCVPQKIAQGISLSAVLVTSACGSLVYHSLGNLDVRAAAYGGIGGAVGVTIGAALAAWMHPESLKLVFGVFVIVMSVLLALKRTARKPEALPIGTE